MSATNYKNRWVDLVSNWVGMAVISLAIFYFTTSDADGREFKKEMDSKASHEYVDKSISTHEEKEELRDELIETMFNVIISNQEKIMDNHDVRITKLEDRR